MSGCFPRGQAGSADDQKFFDIVNQYPSDIRWMFVEISDRVPRVDKIIISNLHDMVANDLSSVEAASRLQEGLGEWYEPAQSCRR